MPAKLPDAERIARKSAYQKKWSENNKDKVRAGTARHREKIALLKAAGGPAWDEYVARQRASNKASRLKHAEREKQKSRDYWQRIRVRKTAERHAARAANPELFK